MSADLPIFGDYTFEEIDRIARMGMSCSWARGSNHLDKYGAAWHAVAEALAAADGPIDRRDLVIIAARAVRDEVDGQMHHYGAVKTGGFGKEFGAGRGFNAYWSQAHTPDPAGFTIDRIALRQIWPQLSDQHRAVLGAFALADNDQAVAAEALAVSVSAFQMRLYRARAAFLELWHDGEVPSRVWRQDSRRERSTAECGTTAGAQRHRRNKEQRCAECVQAESVYYRNARRKGAA